MKRNIWIPKMTRSKLERLLSKTYLNDNDKEDLLDFKYFLLYDIQSCLEKGLRIQLLANQKGIATVPVDMWWLPNIEEKIKGFESKY